MVPVQSILLIPLTVKSRALEYKPRWWSNLLEKQLALCFKHIRRWWSSFQDKQMALRYREKSVVKSILSKSSVWWETVKITETVKIAIEGIIYLIKQFGTSTCNPQPCIVERSGCSCFSDLTIEKKVMQYQILPWNRKGLDWKNGK